MWVAKWLTPFLVKRKYNFSPFSFILDESWGIRVESPSVTADSWMGGLFRLKRALAYITSPLNEIRKRSEEWARATWAVTHIYSNLSGSVWETRDFTHRLNTHAHPPPKQKASVSHTHAHGVPNTTKALIGGASCLESDLHGHHGYCWHQCVNTCDRYQLKTPVVSDVCC